MCILTFKYMVTLTFDVLTQVKVTAHRLNENNMCTKLYGNPLMQT